MDDKVFSSSFMYVGLIGDAQSVSVFTMCLKVDDILLVFSFKLEIRLTDLTMKLRNTTMSLLYVLYNLCNWIA